MAHRIVDCRSAPWYVVVFFIVGQLAATLLLLWCLWLIWGDIWEAGREIWSLLLEIWRGDDS